MADTLTARQSQVLDFIKQHIKDEGIAPTRSEIALAMGFRSKTAAVDHLKALQKKGFVHLHSERSRGIKVLVDEEEDEGLPIIGSVAAGVPIEAIENIEKRVPVPKNLFRDKPTYLLRVKGDSMTDAGILDGDLIAVQKTAKAREGQIVVARIDDEVTVKRLTMKKSGPVLMPENSAYKPIMVAPEDLVIEGVFVGLIRDAAGF